MTHKPTVLLHDTPDDRREIHTALLRGLPPRRAVAFLDWSIAFARLTSSSGQLLARAKADVPAMATKLRAAERGDDAARLLIANEIYFDITRLCHHFDVELLPIIEELERWAKGEGKGNVSSITPPEVAARNWKDRMVKPMKLTAPTNPPRLHSFLAPTPAPLSPL